MRGTNAPTPCAHDGLSLEAESQPLAAPLQARARLPAESLADTALLCAFPPAPFPLPPTFPWEHLRMKHIDINSHLRICFWESKLREDSNFCPIILLQGTPFVYFFLPCVKSCCTWGFSFSHLLPTSPGLRTSWGRELNLSSFNHPQHLVEYLASNSCLINIYLMND